MKQFPAYWGFIGGEPAGVGDTPSLPEPPLTGRTPIEAIEESIRVLRQATADELLQRLRNCTPGFFEKAVVRLLVAMGYGGLAGEGFVTGGPHDGGVDGIIKGDKLGLDVVSVQAKRWAGTVGRPEVQAFVGSMDYVRAKKGVLLTTSSFSKEARSFVERVEAKKVVLVDGKELAELMIAHNVGVVVSKAYEYMEVSSDFFDEGSS